MIVATPTGAIEISPMELSRDLAGVEHLIEMEEWPFVAADLEASHAQPRSTGMVARRDDQLVAFLATHHFGDVSYLDMMVIDPSVRRTRVALMLGYQTYLELQKKGMRGYVGHSTNDSHGVFRYFGFTSGVTFTLMRLEPRSDSSPKRLAPLQCDEQDELVALDAQVFGQPRDEWIRHLLSQSTTRFVGRREQGKLVASLCLRQRRDNAICLDAANSLDFEPLKLLIDETIRALPSHRIEVFARTDSELHHYLIAQGFHVPDFFTRIGPLIEWRKGDAGEAGLSALNRTLSWF